MKRKSSSASDHLAIREANGLDQSIAVGSSSFQSDRPIPEPYTEYGDGRSPELHWDHLPNRARSLVLLVEDPDAPQATPFVHWVMYNLPATVHALPESLAHKTRLDELGGAMQGRASTGTIGYFGPRPPRDYRSHHYHFEVFALDSMLDLPPGADRDQVLRAMKGHVMACGDLIGTFAAPES